MSSKPLAKSGAATLKSYLEQPAALRSLRQVAANEMTPERLVKVTLVAASRDPRLAECTQDSILRGLMTAAELGLDPGGSLGQGALVPYWNSKRGAYEAQFIPGYRGLITLARRSAEVAHVEARIVHDKDLFEIDYGTEPRLVHKPYLGGDWGKIVGAYAIARLRDGSTTFDFMSIHEIEKTRDRSKGKGSGPWQTDFSEMARKTPVRRLCKYLPLSPDDQLGKAIAAENQAEGDGLALDELPGQIPAGVRETGGLSMEDLAPPAEAPPAEPEKPKKRRGRPPKAKPEAEPEPPADPADLDILAENVSMEYLSEQSIGYIAPVIQGRVFEVRHPQSEHAPIAMDLRDGTGMLTIFTFDRPMWLAKGLVVRAFDVDVGTMADGKRKQFVTRRIEKVG